MKTRWDISVGLSSEPDTDTSVYCNVPLLNLRIKFTEYSGGKLNDITSGCKVDKKQTIYSLFKG